MACKSDATGAAILESDRCHWTDAIDECFIVTCQLVLRCSW